jgi:hypothetical protein
MKVHGHTPDCRHSTDKPARLDLTTLFYIAAVQLGISFECTWRIALIYRSKAVSTPMRGHQQDFQILVKPHVRHCKLDAERRLR